jgi:hypothetical protein
MESPTTTSIVGPYYRSLWAGTCIMDIGFVAVNQKKKAPAPFFYFVCPLR